MLRNRFYFRRCVVAINAKVIFRFELIARKWSFHCTFKRILINVHMFRDEFVLKKRVFTSTGVLIFFSRENDMVPLS